MSSPDLTLKKYREENMDQKANYPPIVTGCASLKPSFDFTSLNARFHPSLCRRGGGLSFSDTSYPTGSQDRSRRSEQDGRDLKKRAGNPRRITRSCPKDEDRASKNEWGMDDRIARSLSGRGSDRGRICGCGPDGVPTAPFAG